jgi:hypothetical protein
MLNTRYFFVLILVAAGFSCKDAYRPDIITSAPAYLVVEGVLNVNGPASIRLSRTSKIDSAQIKPELSAQVTVEGKDNTIRTMVSSGGGIYSSPNLNLIIGNEYRLRIRTSAGKEYLSEYVFARQTPPIDTIGRNQTEDQLQFYVNAHDASGNTRYYRWDYDETWEIRAYYYSRVIYVSTPNIVRDRTPTEDVSVGWKYYSSTSILLGSSARLQSDVISQAPITFIPKNDEKTSVRYSLLVKQYALDKAGYEFYDLMKRNTESLGGIFDVQPSEIRGNIKSVSDPNETVIGYVSASTISQRRIFVESTELPFSWRYVQYCPYYTVANQPDSFKTYYRTGTYAPYDAVYSPITGLITGYLSAFPACVDVTERAASTIKPPYW